LPGNRNVTAEAGLSVAERRGLKMANREGSPALNEQAKQRIEDVLKQESKAIQRIKEVVQTELGQRSSEATTKAARTEAIFIGIVFDDQRIGVNI
jgi:hypothetical protein